MKSKDLKDIQDSGFKVPKDYFENFENTIISHAILKNKVKDSGFSVPKGYFDTVEVDILSNIPKKESGKIISLTNRKPLIYISSIAASLVLVFNLVNSNPKVDIDTIETASIEYYLNNEEFNSEELAFLFDDSDEIEDSFNALNFSEEAIEDYVNDNLDINDLYIE